MREIEFKPILSYHDDFPDEGRSQAGEEFPQGCFITDSVSVEAAKVMGSDESRKTSTAS